MNPIVANTVAILLTYNTPHGEDDPHVRRLILEGPDDEELFEAMQKHAPYQTYFRRFFAFVSCQARRLGWPNTAACMEWSSNASFRARVHLHAFLSPATRRNAWDHAIDVRTLRQNDLVFDGIRPDRSPCNVKNRYRSVAIGNGLFYVTAWKYGTLYCESTLQPYRERCSHVGADPVPLFPVPGSHVDPRTSVQKDRWAFGFGAACEGGCPATCSKGPTGVFQMSPASRAAAR